MVKYRRVTGGRIIERPAPDEWLDRSAGWERVEDEPATEASAEENEGSKD